MFPLGVLRGRHVSHFVLPVSCADCGTLPLAYALPLLKVINWSLPIEVVTETETAPAFIIGLIDGGAVVGCRGLLMWVDDSGRSMKTGKIMVANKAESSDG